MTRPSAAVSDATEPDALVCARRISPLVVGTSPGTTYLASDVPAIFDKAQAFYAVNDDDYYAFLKAKATSL